MRLHVLSDVHLEFGGWTPPPVDADALVLAGDIGVGLAGLRWAAENAAGRPVFYVPGNHEYYRATHTRVRAVMRAAADSLGITLLDGDSRTLDGVRFVGCTLWTDFSALGSDNAATHAAAAAELLNDYERIRRDDGSAFAPVDTVRLHATDRAFLQDVLGRPHPGPTVVITHHAPVRACLPDWPRRNPAVVASSVNRLEKLVAPAAGLTTWIHGHVHLATDLRVRGCRVVCNPRGYPHRPGIGFNPELVIDV